MLSLLIFFLVLSILVLIHELGHFLAARRAGVLVEEFGLGLPPRIWGKKVGETLYSINALPFGGFVKLYGENAEEKTGTSERSFANKSKLARIIIIVAGVFMNFVLAVVAFGIVYSVAGIPKEIGGVKILDVRASSPAQVSGLLVGDIIKKVNLTEVKTNSDFIKIIDENKGKKVNLEVERTSNSIKITLTPRENPPEGEGALGVSITSTEIYYPPLWQRPLVGVYYGFKDAVSSGGMILKSMGQIFTQVSKGSLPKDLGSPLAIYAITSETSKSGLLPLINLVGLLSVNLAILNILPFPALDGGRLLFIGVEAVMGRKILPKLENFLNTAGLIFLLFVLAVLFVRDGVKLFQAGSISKFLESMVQ